MGWEHQLEKGRGVSRFRPGVCCECPIWPVVKINGTSTINGFESFNTSYDRICGQKHGGVPTIFVGPIPDSTHHHTYPWRFDSFSEVRMRKHIDGCLKWSVGYITILMKLGGMQSDAERCWVGPRVGLPCGTTTTTEAVRAGTWPACDGCFLELYRAYLFGCRGLGGIGRSRVGRDGGIPRRCWLDHRENGGGDPLKWGGSLNNQPQ